MSSLLLDEPPVVVQPGLARRVGFIEAATLQQLHYWLQRATREHNGHHWVFKSYAGWADELGITAEVARRALEKLRSCGAVVAVQNPQDRRDKTRWWRINYEAGVLAIPSGDFASPSGDFARSARATADVEGRSSETTHREHGGGVDPKPKRRIVRFEKRPVPERVVVFAERVLEAFNEQARTRYRAYTARGAPSEHLKRILGAALDADPPLTLDEARGMIRHQLADPYWTGPPQPGHIFGRGVWERNRVAIATRGARRSSDVVAAFRQREQERERERALAELSDQRGLDL